MVYLSIVVPLLNEETLVTELIRRIRRSVEEVVKEYEILVIDDGSLDKTWELVQNESTEDPRVKGIKFSKNFGHHYAITAGLHEAKGDWVVVMDGDLQDRPEVIPQLIEEARKGFDIVFVSRVNRPEKNYYKVLQKIFYSLLRLLSGIKFDSRQANFSIINRKVVDAFKDFPENGRFYGTTIRWLGFKRSEILAQHGSRLSGKASYTFRKRINLALDIIVAFSDRPLKFVTGFGLSIALFSTGIFTWIFIQAFLFNIQFSEWTILWAALIFSTGSVLTVLGVVGIYIGRIFTQVKNRPLYIISERTDKLI